MTIGQMWSGLAAWCISCVALAGPLAPPAGPVAPTPGPEPRVAISAVNTPGDADSLFRITQPGSYYLTGNISGGVAKHGIEVASGGVTIDLMGFSVNGSTGSLDGVWCSLGLAEATDLAVLNGSIRGWPGDGVDLSNAVGVRVEGVRVSGCGQHGIRSGFASVVTGCTAYANTLNGFLVGDRSVISGCTATSNTGVGIGTGSGSVVSGCSATYNGPAGIGAGSDCVISDCAAWFNQGNGIEFGAGSTVRGCVAGSNRSNGLRGLGGASQVRDNTCAGNGFGANDGAGVHITGAGASNRLEGNNCTGNDRGIDIDSAGNIVLRNTCSGNATNWDIVANNVVAPIIDRRAPGSGAAVGNAFAGSLGTTDPNANFTY